MNRQTAEQAVLKIKNDEVIFLRDGLNVLHDICNSYNSYINCQININDENNKILFPP